MREGKGVGSKAWVGGNGKRWEETGWEEGVKGGNSRERKGLDPDSSRRFGGMKG